MRAHVPRWYAVRDDPQQPLAAERRHTRAAIALGREFADRAAISHHSLLLLHGLPTWRAGRRGIGPVRAALGHADGRHGSPGESRTAYVLRALGHDVEPQVEVSAEGRRYRADFRVRGTRVLVEFDGQVKYADPTALFEEKRREDALRRTSCGWCGAGVLDPPTGRYVRRRCDLRPVRRAPLASAQVAATRVRGTA